MLRVPLLAVRSQDLGREVWKLDLSDEPLLLVNPRVVPRRHLIQSAEFQSLVLPEILRQILIRILLIDQIREVDDSEDWTSRWLRFACSLPGLVPLPEFADPDEDLDWIDQVMEHSVAGERWMISFESSGSCDRRPKNRQTDP